MAKAISLASKTVATHNGQPALLERLPPMKAIPLGMAGLARVAGGIVRSHLLVTHGPRERERVPFRAVRLIGALCFLLDGTSFALLVGNNALIEPVG